MWSPCYLWPPRASRAINQSQIRDLLLLRDIILFLLLLTPSKPWFSLVPQLRPGVKACKAKSQPRNILIHIFLFLRLYITKIGQASSTVERIVFYAFKDYLVLKTKIILSSLWLGVTSSINIIILFIIAGFDIIYNSPSKDLHFHKLELKARIGWTNYRLVA